MYRDIYSEENIYLGNSVLCFSYPLKYLNLLCPGRGRFFWWNCVHCREGCTCQKLQLISNLLTLESIAMNDYALALCIRNLAYKRPESCSCKVRNFKAHSSLQRPPLSFMRKAKKPQESAHLVSYSFHAFLKYFVYILNSSSALQESIWGSFCTSRLCDQVMQRAIPGAQQNEHPPQKDFILKQPQETISLK